MAGSGAVAWADGLGTATRFNRPSGVSVDSNGAVYVADANNHRIRMVSSSGVCLVALHISLAASVSVGCFYSLHVREERRCSLGWVEDLGIVKIYQLNLRIVDDDVMGCVCRSGIHVGRVWGSCLGRWLGDCSFLPKSKWCIGGFQWGRVCRRY